MPGSKRIMKHTVLSSGLHDADIRPPALLNEFKRLSEEDAAAFFGAADALEAVPCPACGADSERPAFEKSGFSYVECGACRSLYVTPRPRSELLARYHAESRASRYRAAQFTEATAVQRRQHILRGYASWMGQVVAEHLADGELSYGDLGSYWPSLFDEVSELELFNALYAVAPRTTEGAKTPVSNVSLDEMPELHVVSAFEKLEHLHEPQRFLSDIGARMKSGGLLFLTTRTCSGFDLQVLWDKAPYVFVPEHLNLFSIPGLEALVQRSGFELLELSTPGQLDVEQVLQACAADPSVTLPPFVRILLTERDRLAHSDFQAFLQKHRLSSHVRMVARKSNQPPPVEPVV